MPAAAGEEQDLAVRFAGAEHAVTTGKQTPGGVYLPGADQRVQSKPGEGIVRAVGDDVTLKVAEGDRVLYRPWTGIEVRISEHGGPWVNHQITPQRDVLAIVDPGEAIEVVVRPIPKPEVPQRRAG